MRDDMMDVEIYELDTFVPARILVPLRLKTKTTKTP